MLRYHRAFAQILCVVFYNNHSFILYAFIVFFNIVELVMTDSATPDQYHNFIDQTETEIRSAELQTVPLVIGIVAGEVSGDSLGADFMQQMNNLRGDIVWVGVGGTKMQAQGLQSIFSLERLAVMGLVEVMAQLPDLLKARRELLSAFKAADINWFIGIDAPDFNLESG